MPGARAAGSSKLSDGWWERPGSRVGSRGSQSAGEPFSPARLRVPVPRSGPTLPRFTPCSLISASHGPALPPRLSYNPFPGSLSVAPGGPEAETCSGGRPLGPGKEAEACLGVQPRAPWRRMGSPRVASGALARRWGWGTAEPGAGFSPPRAGLPAAARRIDAPYQPHLLGPVIDTSAP